MSVASPGGWNGGASAGPLPEASAKRRDKMVLSYSTHLAHQLKAGFRMPFYGCVVSRFGGAVRAFSSAVT
jgi:hypothetical protein